VIKCAKNFHLRHTGNNGLTLTLYHHNELGRDTCTIQKEEWCTCSI